MIFSLFPDSLCSDSPPSYSYLLVVSCTQCLMFISCVSFQFLILKDIFTFEVIFSLLSHQQTVICKGVLISFNIHFEAFPFPLLKDFSYRIMTGTCFNLILYTNNVCSVHFISISTDIVRLLLHFHDIM